MLLVQVQSFDQTFDKMNKALQVSCQKGLPVRVVRSHKVPARANNISAQLPRQQLVLS